MGLMHWMIERSHGCEQNYVPPQGPTVPERPLDWLLKLQYQRPTR